MELAGKGYSSGAAADIARNILTLRYDPAIGSSLPGLGWRDLIPDRGDIALQSVEDCIERYILDRVDQAAGPVAVALSSGVDSSLPLAYIRKLFPGIKIHAISTRFPDSPDETPAARRIADFFTAEHHVLHVEDYLEILPEAIGITGMPFWDNHWYFVARFASGISGIMASGDGGDEVFGGYTFRYEKFLSRTTPESTPIEKARAYLDCHERDWVADQADVFQKSAGFSWDVMLSRLVPYFDNPLDRLSQVLLADYNGKLLHNFAHVNGSINARFGLRPVTPLLSDDLIQLASRCGSGYKYDEARNLGKIHLRGLVDRLGISHLISRGKLGFSVNTRSLWRRSGRDLFDCYLDDGRVISDGLISREWISKYSGMEDPDVRIVNKMLGILALEVWYRICISGEMSHTDRL